MYIVQVNGSALHDIFCWKNMWETFTVQKLTFFNTEWECFYKQCIWNYNILLTIKDIGKPMHGLDYVKNEKLNICDYNYNPLSSR